MKLVVGSRGNFKSTKSIIDGTGGKISEIYLSVDNARWGSGRNYVHEVNFKDAKKQADYAGKFGIKLSLAFNTVCFGAEKFTDDFYGDFIDLLKRAQESGFFAIILSDPYLMKISRENFPDFPVIVSVFSEVDSENRLEYYNNLGVNRIIVPHELNRDLEKLKRFVELSGCDIEVITNLGCYHYCARGDAHSLFTGHYAGHICREVFGDYYTVFCNSRKLNYPWEFLSQDWIRPEDIYRYEEIGVNHFKIAGRATSTSWIIRAANAYLDRSYEGNVFNLISSYYPFTDRTPIDKQLFYIPNKALNPVMDRLYKCGHECLKCNRCRDTYKSLTESVNT